MYQKALSIYYSLTLVVVGATFFVVSPTSTPELAAWQDGMVNQFVTAFKQTIGDGPWMEDLALVYEGVNSFYQQSSDTTIALLTQPETDEDVIFVFHQVYLNFAASFSKDIKTDQVALEKLMPPIPPNFMGGEPLYNIIPYDSVVKTIDSGSVAGMWIIDISPVNSTNKPWVTIADNMTGQLYCLALYNGTVNKYLGPCKNDYH